MEAQTKYICILGFLVVLGIAVGVNGVEARYECGKNTSPDMEAFKLAPCASAAQDTDSTPSKSCCTQVETMGKNPPCLCAVMLSNVAKSSGVKAEVAITIPKRCNLVNRPIGYKCGGKLLSDIVT